MSESDNNRTDLTHFDASGRARMVDVGGKAETQRIAVARGRIHMKPETVAIIREGRAAKGDVLAVAQVAAIMAAKKTPEIIPMCHPLLLTRVDVDFELTEDSIEIEARVDTKGQTGVEMEALTAVSAAALTIYDMVKAVDRGMTIGDIRVEKKQGGRSGDWTRDQLDAVPAADPGETPAADPSCDPETGICAVDLPFANPAAPGLDLAALGRLGGVNLGAIKPVSASKDNPDR
ncbi:MAG: cyclic pyranopterin monophosphate synthase MoaC [Thermomicrobiales bacterium]